MDIYGLIMTLALDVLIVAVFFFAVWALTNVLIWSCKKVVGMLSGPARRNLEVVRTKKDLAEIQVGALTAAESVMKMLARSDSGYRGR